MRSRMIPDDLAGILVQIHKCTHYAYRCTNTWKCVQMASHKIHFHALCVCLCALRMAVYFGTRRTRKHIKYSFANPVYPCVFCVLCVTFKGINPPCYLCEVPPAIRFYPIFQFVLHNVLHRDLGRGGILSQS